MTPTPTTQADDMAALRDEIAAMPTSSTVWTSEPLVYHAAVLANVDRFIALRASRPTVTAGYEALRTENAKLRELLALKPSGWVGPDWVPWFIHCGISHGDNRPDCVVCAALAAVDKDTPPEGLPVRQLLTKAKAALMFRHDEAEAAAYDAIEEWFLATPASPTSEAAGS